LLNHDLLVLSKDAVARLSHSLDPASTPISGARCPVDRAGAEGEDRSGAQSGSETSGKERKGEHQEAAKKKGRKE